MRRKWSAEFKSKVAIEAVREQKTLNEIAKENETHPIQVGKWKKELLEHAKDLYVDKRKKERKETPSEEDLQRKIGQLTMENDWLKKKLGL